MQLILAKFERLGQRQDIILAVLLMVAVFMMILPLPTILVDVLIAINLAISLVLLATSIYVRDPLDLSVLPSLLLVSTLYRLALTVSTSRLILLQHDAGDIVYAFGNFVVGGNLAVGIIVFSIITVVQFIVITKGAERTAEVSARFSLDAMPGKQMSIDSDLRAGSIDAAEAKRQRGLVQKESQLYGAMDGAMKFVKGDAIASIVVILVNIIGGVIVGVVQHNMSIGEGFRTYAVLSIGDGLVSQIPALIISIAAGIVVTRVPGETHNNLAMDMTGQFARQPRAIFIAAVVLGIFALVPGFPILIFAPAAALLGALGMYLKRRSDAGGSNSASNDGTKPGSDSATSMMPGAEPLTIIISELAASVPKLEEALDAVRWKKFEELGVALPKINISVDGKFTGRRIDILLYGELVASVTPPESAILYGKQVGELSCAERIDHLPFGGLNLQWINTRDVDTLQQTGVTIYRNESCIGYIVSLVIDRFADEFIGVQETRYLMDAMESKYGELVKEMQRQIQVSKVAEVLQRLVAEGISIRDLRTIFESLIEWAPKEKESVMLAEYARIALRRQIIARHRGNKPRISVWLIGDAIENSIRSSVRQTSAGAYSTLAANEIENIVSRIKAVTQLATSPEGVLVTAVDVRRFVRKFLEKDNFRLPVLSFQELGDDADMHVLGVIETLEPADAPTA